ncbi:uncharacterized protein LOC128680898 [Plodia interpunctella]|uniref:uncharacterized protein LOC128680898 n=1 Tax=Plodia interpunctella TaxID=58824 RepID=UPI00236850E8|nr:uncharacterized protein LOC128680898 [Plodia interpunctella]
MDLQKSCEIINKIKLFYEKLETSKYVMNNYYADAYLEKLKDMDDPEVAQIFLPPVVGYMTDMLSHCLIRSENYHISVRIFFTKILGQVCTKELYFVKVFDQSSDYINKCFKNIHSTDMNKSLIVAYLELAILLIDHGSGLEWILKTGIWKDVLMLVNKNIFFIVRHVYKFVSKFMWSLNDIGDLNNLNAALNFILAPIEEFGLINQAIISDEYETEVCKKIEPMCHMLLAIFTEKDRVHTSNKLMNCLLNERFLTHKIGICLNKLRSEEIVILCTKVSFWATLANIFQWKPLEPGVMYSKEDFLGLLAFYYSTLKFLTLRRNPKLVIDYGSACCIIWDTIWQKQMPFLKYNNKNIEMQSQMMFITVMPLLIWVTRNKKYTEIMEDEIVVKNVTTMMNNAHVEHTMRAGYNLRDVIFETDSVMQTLTHSMKMLNRIKTRITDEMATLLFQCLFFILRSYNEEEISVDEVNCSKVQKINLYSHMMEIMLSLVKHYNITWNESLEVLNLYSLVHGILKKPDLPSKFVIVSLTVLAFSVKKFLTPNLSLLLESTPGSAVHEIGSLIHLKMNDEDWEVRDSALELLFVCTDISFIKFPPFQKQIIAEKLINVAAGIALNDRESYVQASALKCLGAAARVSCVWEQLKAEYPNILELLLSTLCMNPDGMVRKEACTVLCEIYQHVKMLPCAKRCLYEHMVSAALNDFHWEVQISALRFWRHVIKTLLTDQGMLDGTFPPVTFSKESRKIVHLNPTEIQRRLMKVLDELSAIGCLSVLVKLLNEETEVDIMELTLNISLEFLEILDNYNLSECFKVMENDLRIEEITYQIVEDDDEAMDITPSTSEKAEGIIDGILKSDDVNLLSNIYERHMSMDASESRIKPKIRLQKFATPSLFVVYVKSKDFKALLDHKKQWKKGVRSLSALLDDFLGYECNEEVNSLDCY